MRLINETVVRARPKSSPPRSAARPEVRYDMAVFTAIDGTLLDARTFEAGANREAVRRLHAANVPIVPITVMTLEEVEPIARELGLRHAMVIEAGGVIARWTDGQWVVEPCGPDADTLLETIREIEDRSGANLLVYSVLSESEASRLSGRSGEMLRQSTRRRFSEPFTIESGNLAAVKDAAASIGFSVRRGRRFFHLCRACDEGEAFVRLRDELRCEIAVAVGGSPVDAELLGRAEIPIIVPGPDGKPDPELLESVPRAWIAPAPAPDGWAAAVNAACGELLETRQRTRIRKGA